jgi:hypothetical protein
VDTQQIRSAALAAAATALSGSSPGPGDLAAYAAQLVPWISAPEPVRLDCTLTIPGTNIRLHSSHGGTMATNAVIGVNTTVAVNVLPEDANDNVTGDEIAFSSDDTAGAILDGVLSADGRTWTGSLTGATGTVTVTATCPAVPSVAAYTAVINVITGPTTHLVGTVTVT